MKPAFATHIEGLRALAVVPIVLFHLDERLSPGGFAGVDVFFVISGFLITRMIVAEGEAFRFSTFYARRIFRLLPALVATLLGTLIAGWFVLAPADYAALAQSALAALVGVANVHFFLTVDYFSAGSRFPLLHTWSLGVEEQFYLVWPLVLFCAQEACVTRDARGLFFRDPAHLTNAGSEFLITHVQDELLAKLGL
jgi:peptidoglycan/LPS O-acetylase OafA/YrhL